MTYWTRYGSFAAGMARHTLATRGPFAQRGRWTPAPGDVRRYPQNQFVQNGEEADRMIEMHALALAMPVHDRPEWLAQMAGAYGRPDGAFVQPHALWALSEAEA